jgi:hypothetical protein
MGLLQCQKRTNADYDLKVKRRGGQVGGGLNARTLRNGKDRQPGEALPGLPALKGKTSLRIVRKV